MVDARQDGWRENIMKTRKIRNALMAVLGGDDEATDRILGIVKAQNEY